MELHTGSAIMAATSELQSRLDLFVRRAGELYTLPRVAADVLELTRDATVDTARLKQCIERDPALTARLLRVVNSSLFGMCREVTDLNQALALMGIKPLKLLVLGFSLPEGLFRHVTAEFLARYWRHTLTTAVAAREICLLLKQPSGDEAFIAGLLKHLGMLVLVQQVGVPYVQFIERMQAHGMDLLAAERLALGFDHTQLTARLLEHWRLPAAIVQIAAGAEDETLSEPMRKLSRLVDTADAMAVWLVRPRVDTLPSLRHSLRSLGSLKEGQFAELLVSLHDKVRQLAGVLSLELPQQQTAEQLTLEAYRRLSAAAEEAAGEMLGLRHDAVCAAEFSALDETVRLRETFEGLAERPIAPERMDDAAAPPVERAAPCAVPPTTASSAAAAELWEELVAAVALCRRNRQPLALALVELDRFDALLAQRGGAQAMASLRQWREACQQLEHEWTLCLNAGQGRLALLLMACERQEATRLARQLLSAAAGAANPARASASIGVAAIGQIPRNFPPAELLTAARRCLSGAQASGGNCVKSIDL